jgi:SAM-dependent methyltransferase
LSELPEYVARNRAAWDADADTWVERGRRAWAQEEPSWGLWGIPESELQVLPEVSGRDVIELGCGTAYFSAWLARRGARVVGIDNSPRQLETARMLQTEFGLEFPLLLGTAEHVPLPDASFDLAISEYGASIWCDPYAWVPEAARLLRPGGRLVFLRNSTLLILCSPDEGAAEERLVRAQFGMHRFEWPEEDGVDGGVEFHVSHGDWVRLLRGSGFEIEDLVEIQAPPDAVSDPAFDFVTAEWARSWPSEEIWVARRR